MMKKIKSWVQMLLMYAAYSSIFYKEIYNIDNKYLNNVHALFFVYSLFVCSLVILASFITFKACETFVSESDRKRFKTVIDSSKKWFVVMRVLNSSITLGLAIVGAWWFFIVMTLQEFSIWYMTSKFPALKKAIRYDELAKQEPPKKVKEKVIKNAKFMSIIND